MPMGPFQLRIYYDTVKHIPIQAWSHSVLGFFALKMPVDRKLNLKADKTLSSVSS